MTEKWKRIAHPSLTVDEAAGLAELMAMREEGETR